jgi:hypothetical protein
MSASKPQRLRPYIASRYRARRTNPYTMESRLRRSPTPSRLLG